MSKTRSGAELIVVYTLIKVQLSAHNVATERGTTDKTEATRFSQCALELMVNSATMSQSHGAELLVVL